MRGREGGVMTKVYASGATTNFLSWGQVTLGLLGFCTHRGGGAGYRWCSCWLRPEELIWEAETCCALLRPSLWKSVAVLFNLPAQTPDLKFKTNLGYMKCTLPVLWGFIGFIFIPIIMPVQNMKSFSRARHHKAAWIWELRQAWHQIFQRVRLDKAPDTQRILDWNKTPNISPWLATGEFTGWLSLSTEVSFIVNTWVSLPSKKTVSQNV